MWDLGLQLWRDKVITDQEVEKKIIIGLLNLIERERDGEMVKRELLKNLIRMLASVGLYAERFEKNFIVSTGKYYSQEVSTFFSTKNEVRSNYMRQSSVIALVSGYGNCRLLVTCRRTTKPGGK